MKSCRAVHHYWFIISNPHMWAYTHCIVYWLLRRFIQPCNNQGLNESSVDFEHWRVRPLSATIQSNMNRRLRKENCRPTPTSHFNGTFAIQAKMAAKFDSIWTYKRHGSRGLQAKMSQRPSWTTVNRLIRFVCARVLTRCMGWLLIEDRELWITWTNLYFFNWPEQDFKI